MLDRVQAVARDLAAARGVMTNRSMFEDPIAADGDGTPVILLHGFMGHPSSMERFAESAIERGHPVVAPQRNPTDTVDYQVAGLLHLAESMSEPSHVVGHSLGGVVAVLAAVKQPDLFASVATVASPLGGSHWARLPLIRQSPLSEVRPGECAANRVGMVPVPLLSVAGEFDPLVPVKSALALSSAGLSVVVPEGHATVLWSEMTVYAVATFQNEVERLRSL